jgi:REP element-mobilizing transposase RayT
MIAEHEQHGRRSIRLPGYDYAGPGHYFVTVCTHLRECLFGEVVEGQMRTSEIGAVVREEWFRSTRVRPGVALDAFVVMPNHVHGIIEIVGARRGVARRGATHRVAPTAITATQRAAPTGAVEPRGAGPSSLGAMMGQFKSVSTKRINRIRGALGTPVWQRNYYEHIIRSEEALNRIREYICVNPQRWPYDSENPARVPGGKDELEEIIERDIEPFDGW